MVDSGEEEPERLRSDTYEQATLILTLTLTHTHDQATLTLTLTLRSGDSGPQRGLRSRGQLTLPVPLHPFTLELGVLMVG